MAKTIEILNNEKHIVRVKVLLAKGDTEGNLILSLQATAWGKFGWKEGTMLEVRQDDIDKNELTIRVAPRSIREQLRTKSE
jgi:hypothetical protein